MQICTNCEQDLDAFFESKFFFHFLRSHKDSAICSFHRPFRQELIGRNKRERGRTAFVQFFNHCENGFCICSIYLLTVKMNIAQKLQKININAKSVHAKYKVNRCLARYSPRATTTNQPTNRAPNKPAWPGPNSFFTGEIKSFVTHIMENQPRHLVHIVF